MASSPTLEVPVPLDEAEVVVVGAGPAGSYCAARLAERGHDVLLLDKSEFPRDKPCGDGITSTSVKALEELGLDPLLKSSQGVVGLRTFLDHKPRSKSFPSPARCISRLDLDQALLDAALERGARFRQVRVDGPLMDKDAVLGVSVSADASILASCVIAADGATSRLRRGCGFSPTAPGQRAYAVRRYFSSQRLLAPYFDIFVPLLYRSLELLGYGWVFPLDERTANIGVGYYRQDTIADSPPLTAVLDEFIKDLLLHEDRYGILEPLDKPFGSPVGIGFGSDRCQFQRILFAGDAAQMTDPITGEGIGYALLGGGLVADAAHSALTRGKGADWHRNLDLGRELDRRLLRLGQDSDLLRRIAARRLSRGTQDSKVSRDSIRGKPFLSMTAHAMAPFYELPNLQDTPISSFVTRHSSPVAKALDLLNEKALDEIKTRFPFIPQTLHLRLRADAGPVASVVVFLASLMGGRGADSTVVSTALGVEFLAMLPIFVAQAIDRPTDDISKLNNTFAMLVADFVLSRALSCGASAGAEVANAIAVTGCSMCEAEAMEQSVRKDAESSVEQYFDVAEMKEGSLFALATSLGGMLSERSRETIAALDRYGQLLGVAFRISNDICHLVSDDEATRSQAKSMLQGGYYSLPVIEALLSNGSSTQWLSAGFDAVISEIHDLGGFEQALTKCELTAEAAKKAMGPTGLNEAMADLCDLPVAWARSALYAFHSRRTLGVR